MTQPIVAETLRPILERLGPRAAPDDILALKVLDPAMGSGAFLVEACRQLADALVKAWEVHGVRPPVPPDEDALLYAKRLVATRCLYGVDRNELAAELGKLSLWLATLARDHEFTFLDHCIRHGDSLVGLDRRQIEALNWTPQPAVPVDLMQALLRSRLAEAEREREHIRTALDNEPEDQQRLVLARAERALADPKLVGDAVIAAFFRPTRRGRAKRRGSGARGGGRAGRHRLAGSSAATCRRAAWRSPVRARLAGVRPDRAVPLAARISRGFDRDIPVSTRSSATRPSARARTRRSRSTPSTTSIGQALHPGAHGNSDIVAHFFRRSYGLLRERGCLWPARHEHDPSRRHARHRLAADPPGRRHDLHCPPPL